MKNKNKDLVIAIGMVDNKKKKKKKGMSMGGMITQRMVVDNSERFKSYVLIASMARTPDLQTGPKGELKRLIEDRSFR